MSDLYFTISEPLMRAFIKDFIIASKESSVEGLVDLLENRLSRFKVVKLTRVQLTELLKEVIQDVVDEHKAKRTVTHNAICAMNNTGQPNPRCTCGAITN